MQSMSVMLVDDDRFVHRLLKQQLSLLGFSDVVAHVRASDALAALEADIERFAIIVCDLQMPDLDGIEFVRHVARKGYRGGLLLMSGESSRILQTAESLACAHGLNVLGALEKPGSSSQLQSALASVRPGISARRRESPRERSPEELRAAIADHQLVNHYQPKVEIKSGSVVGVESLVRWQHPTDGLVFPDQIVGPAEAHGLVDLLTQRVLFNALRDASAWRRAGWCLDVAVNVSMQNLVSLEFPDVVVEMARQFGVPTTRVVLEITESQITSDPLASLDVLARLRLKRIRLSIDDFGTGYSSLAQLHSIPFGELKIDRSFIHGANRDPAARAIVDASFGMAKTLGMTTVAEGVEDQADWDWLKQETTCDFAQGYFIARPMSAGDLINWLAAWRGREPGRAGSKA